MANSSHPLEKIAVFTAFLTAALRASQHLQFYREIAILYQYYSERISIMKQETMINDLTQGSVAKRLVLFTLPLAASNLLQVVYNLVDMIVVGQFVGSTGLSGVSIGGDLMHIFMYIGIGFSSAGQIIISQLVGKQDYEGVNRAIGTMFSFILGLSIVCSVISLLGQDLLLSWMNTPAESWEEAKAYSAVCFWGLFFIFGYNIVSAILRGMGDSTRPFIFVAVAAVLNLLLDLLFVAVFNWSTFGAALATVIGQGVSFIGSLIYLFKRRQQFGFDFKPHSFIIDKSKLFPLIKLGFPMTLQSMAIVLSSLLVTSWINEYGLVASAVTGIGAKLRDTMSIVTNSLSTATSTMVGQNMGAGKIDRVKRVVWSSFSICMGAYFIYTAVFLLFPVELFSIFNTDPEVLAWAPRYVWTLAISLLCMCMMSSFNGLINGIGFAALSFAIGMLDGVIARVGLALLLGRVFDMGIMGFWLGSGLAGMFTAIPGIIYYFSGAWKKRKLVIQ